jgi:hypothetical protein
MAEGWWAGFPFDWIGPNGKRYGERLQRDALEADRMGRESGIERDAALRGECGRSATSTRPASLNAALARVGEINRQPGYQTLHGFRWPMTQLL